MLYIFCLTIFTRNKITAEHLTLPQILGGATILWTKLILALPLQLEFDIYIHIYTYRYNIYLNIISIHITAQNELFRCQYWRK